MAQPVYVFIAASSVGKLHVGITRNLALTMRQFKERSVKPSGWLHGVDQLLFSREFADAEQAYRFHETLSSVSCRTLKGIVRAENPAMLDLSRPWFDADPSPTSPVEIQPRPAGGIVWSMDLPRFSLN